MKKSYSEMQAETVAALNDPQVGDRFHEMFSFYVYVVERVGVWVLTMEGSPPCEFPNGSAKWQTLDEFKQRFFYDTIDQPWVLLGGRGYNVEGWATLPAPQTADAVAGS